MVDARGGVVGPNDLMDVWHAVVALDDSTPLPDLKAAAAKVAQAARWCDGAEVKLARLIAAKSVFPDKDMADAGRRSNRSARKASRRAETMTETPVLGNALDDGKIGAEHADAAGAALRELEGEQRKQLAKRIDALVDLASSSTPEEFARRVREESRRVTDDEGEGRLARQQCAVRFNHRVDPATGMIEFWGRFDPLRGVPFVNRLKARMAELFAKEVPAGCPTDPLEKNAYLQALALLDLCEGKGGRSGRPEVVVVVDARDRPDRRGPIVDWGIPVELPIRVLTELVPDADVHTVVVRGGVVLHAPGNLGLGRTTRLANAAQRRVLRAMYPTCAVPDCPVRFNHCKIHHVVWWRHGGRTDLDNLLPVCTRHHTAIHDEGWVAQLTADRTVTITLPDGTVMTTGPPSRRFAA